MTISAELEENGWVLAVTGAWGASGFADFALDPDGTPAVVLTVVGEGFTRAGGVAVADHAATRTLVATKPVRLPYAPGMGTGTNFVAVLDETDNGDGTRTVRLALSDRVYQSETVTAVFAAGWRDGEAGGSASVANNSARAYPLPIVRWAVPTFAPPPVGTKHRVEVIVASHFPRHFGISLNQAVAGVKFTFTDGTHTATGWALEPITSPLYEQELRCWSAEVDLDGFDAGPVTVHWDVYPWVGAVRSSGSGHTTTMAGDFVTDAEAPIHVVHDPDRVAYPYKYIAVDAATGDSDPASVTIAADWASAKAGTRAADTSTALQALKLAKLKNNASAGNGFDTGGNSADYCVLGLLAGVQGIGGTGLTSAYLATAMGRVIIAGDPDDPDPRANVILRGRVSDGSNPVHTRGANYWFRDLTIELGDGGGVSSINGGILQGAGRVHADNVTFRGRADATGGKSAIFDTNSGGSASYISLTNIRLNDYGCGFEGGASRAGLVRGSQFSRSIRGVVHAGNRRITDTGGSVSYGIAFENWAVADDVVVWQCEGRRIQEGVIAPHYASGSGTAEDPWTMARLALVDVLAEQIANPLNRHFAVGESSYSQIQDSIWDGVTMVGNGVNLHVSSNTATKANLFHIGNVMRNCAIGRQATKQDVFSEDGSLTGSFELLYGVGNSGFVSANAIQMGAWNDYQHAFWGLASTGYLGSAGQVEAANAWFGFEDFEAYQFGATVPDGAGGGDYHAADGSPLLSRGTVSTVDVDLDGELRGVLFAAGVYGPAEEALPVVVQPLVATIGLTGSAGGLTGHAPAVSATLTPAAGVLALVAGAGALHYEPPAPGGLWPWETRMSGQPERMIKLR